VASREIFLIRHGETEWNAEGRYQGQMDSPLTPDGRAQALRVGRRLAEQFRGTPPVELHVSPLGRTRETAEIIGPLGNYSALRLEERLQEVTIGSWDGLIHADIDNGWPGRLDGATAFDWYFRAPDGETYEMVLARVISWLNDQRGPVVAISHGLVGRLIRGAYLGLSCGETLCLPVPQDTIWHLRDGKVHAIDT
jgi:broad specificity phosphatase PhoE